MKRIKPPLILVLSGGITPTGRLPFYIKDRLNHAYKYFIQGFGHAIAVSGKWSYLYDTFPEKTEATSMTEYLKKLGMTDKKILAEHYSQDLISSAYHIKKEIVIPQKYDHIRIITSDFQEERVRYVFQKVLGKKFTVSIDCIPAHLSATSLWRFFTYESTALINTKRFLRNMKSGDHEYLSDKFYTSPFYKLQKVGFTRDLAREGQITRRKNANTHYSLRQIYKTREEIFTEYDISEMQKKTLKADFWSGIFLNFLGKNSKKDLFCLKFVLYNKDKAAFLNEVKITEHITKQGLTFVPKVVASQTTKAPYWYLYKVVEGTMSGEFSLQFSYRDTFFRTSYPCILSEQLKQIRSLDLSTLNPLICDSDWYHRNNRNRMEVIQQDKKLVEKYPIILEAHNLLEKSVPLIVPYSKYPTHNDLHPGNIIYADERKVFFIDFERMGYNSIATDFARIYSLSWTNPFFQHAFYQEFVSSLSKSERDEFEYIFPYAYLAMLHLLLKHTVQWKYLSDKLRRKEVRKYIVGELAKTIQAITKNQSFFS